MSNISTVSDDSQPDSGYDNSNWVSNLAALSEIEESDYEIIPKLNWAEIHASNDQSSIVDDNADVESVSNPNEMMSREDWDRILCLENKPLDIPFVCNQSTTSEETLKEKSDLVNTSTRLKENALRKKSSHLSGTANNSEKTLDKERASSWLSNIFRKSTTAPSNNHEIPTEPNRNDECKSSSQQIESQQENSTVGLIVIPEVEEMRISEENVSRSFDDNCDFEHAEECDEEKEDNIEIN